MNEGFLELMWQQAEDWRLVIAVLSGMIVSVIYFYSLRWSIGRISESEHKFKLFAFTALLRIAMFFGVLVLVGHRNVMVILLYVAAFFFTKVVIVWYEKRHLISGSKNKAE